MFLEIGGEVKQKPFIVRNVAIFLKDFSENLIEVFGYWWDMYMTEVDFLVGVTLGELQQINKGVILIEGGDSRLDELGVLCCPKAIVGIGELLDMAAVAIVGELEGMEVLRVVLLEDVEGAAQVFSVSTREEIIEIILTFRVDLLGVLTHGYKVHTLLFFYIKSNSHSNTSSNIRNHARFSIR